ncbi:MAG TPA: hypothetical protein VK778_10870 [Solirubrobacteraceae bacterium]|nr:hypothetical protein [Solirubrobacteraceae bacterium]
MSHRPLVLVSALAVGDYLLWNWSLNSNHDVLALVSGLTLPPLAVACLWLLALSVVRVIARSTRRPAGRAGRAARRVAHGQRGALRRRQHRRAPVPAGLLDEPPGSGKPAGTSSRKLAA